MLHDTDMHAADDSSTQTAVMADAAVGGAGDRAGHRLADHCPAHLHHLLCRRARPRHHRHNNSRWRTLLFMSVPLPVGSGVQPLLGRSRRRGTRPVPEGSIQTIRIHSNTTYLTRLHNNQKISSLSNLKMLLFVIIINSVENIMMNVKNNI